MTGIYAATNGTAVLAKGWELTPVIQGGPRVRLNSSEALFALGVSQSTENEGNSQFQPF